MLARTGSFTPEVKLSGNGTGSNACLNQGPSRMVEFMQSFCGVYLSVIEAETALQPLRGDVRDGLELDLGGVGGVAYLVCTWPRSSALRGSKHAIKLRCTHALIIAHPANLEESQRKCARLLDTVLGPVLPFK